MASGSLAEAPAAYWELAELPVDLGQYQHLLFEITWPYIGFHRQFFDEGEVEALGFSWELACTDAAPAVTMHGARRGEVCELAVPWLFWDEFRSKVEQHIQGLVDAGCRFTGHFVM